MDAHMPATEDAEMFGDPVDDFRNEETEGTTTADDTMEQGEDFENYEEETEELFL